MQNLIRKYEMLLAERAWTGIDGAAREDKAFRMIEERMQKAADDIGMAPKEKQTLLRVIAGLQDDNARLRALLQSHNPSTP